MQRGHVDHGLTAYIKTASSLHPEQMTRPLTLPSPPMGKRDVCAPVLSRPAGEKDMCALVAPRVLRDRGRSSMLGTPSLEVLLLAPRWSIRLGGVERSHH